MSRDTEPPPEAVDWLRPQRWHDVALGHQLVRRPRLLERLSAAPLGGVVLVCAPPGSGKSVLLRSWIGAEGLDDRVAWVSVEHGERDGPRFWLAVIDELARVVGGDRPVTHVSPAPRLSARAAVERLLADLEGVEQPLLLVIDDLHELDSADALECLELLVHHVPARMRVVLSTRAEPRLGLHRLRLAGALSEIRDQQLRFSVPESRELLDEAGIALSDCAVAVLHERTEGWAAGLRLAAISLAGHPDPERFVTEFCGGDRTVAQYLLAEVLERQHPETRELLLRTSVLERVSGPLADVLTGGCGSEHLLMCLEDHNAFVTALDAGRSWFRYHQLFADLLVGELRRTRPAIIGPLHRAAARWYEQHGYVVEAIRHAQAGRDWSQAVRLLADHFVDLTLDGRGTTMKALLSAFPARAPTEDPELAVAFAGAAIMDGVADDAEAYLRHAERLCGAVAEERRRRFELRVAGMRVWLACWRGDFPAVSEGVRSLQAALAAPTPQELAEDNDIHAMALLFLGTAELWAEQLDDACSDLRRALALARRIARPYLEIGCLAYLGLAAVLRGSPVSVLKELAGEAVLVGESNGWGDHPVLRSALAAHAIVDVWLGRLGDAERSLDRAEHLLSDHREPALLFLLHYGRGLLRFAQNRPEDALAAFSAAEEEQKSMASGHVLGVELQSRLMQTLVVLDDTAAARARLARIDPRVRNRNVILVSEAVLLLAEGRPQDALDVLDALAHSPRPIATRGPQIHALLCRAVAQDRLGDRRAAEASLDHALEMAGPDRLVLPFVVPPARDLLRSHRRTGDPALLAAIAEVLAEASRGEGTPPPELLSPAELRVLGYLAGTLSTDEIASQLYLSANTVRTHVRHIYAKLDAHTRGEAVARARELGLLAGR